MSIIKYTNLKVTDIHAWSENEHNKGGIEISWATDDIGFGVLTIFKGIDDKILIDSEGMGEEFIKDVLMKLLDESTELI